MSPHSKLVRDILAAFGGRPGIRLWKQSVGQGISRDGRRVLRWGIKGMADISGLASPGGRRIEIEVKTGTGVSSSDQDTWAKMIRRTGGFHMVARSVADVEAAFREAGILSD